MKICNKENISICSLGERLKISVVTFFSMWLVRQEKEKNIFSSKQPWFCDALDKQWALLINRNKLHRPKINKGDARQRVSWVSEAGDDGEKGAPLSITRALIPDSSLIEAREANGSRRHHPLISPNSHTAVKGYEWHYPKAMPALPPCNQNASDVQGSGECGMIYTFVCLTRRAEVEALCVCELGGCYWLHVWCEETLGLTPGLTGSRREWDRYRGDFSSRPPSTRSHSHLLLTRTHTCSPKSDS